MIYLILALLLTHLLALLLGFWLAIGVYERERCNIEYEIAPEKQKKSLVQTVSPRIKRTKFVLSKMPSGKTGSKSKKVV